MERRTVTAGRFILATSIESKQRWLIERFLARDDETSH